MEAELALRAQLVLRGLADLLDHREFLVLLILPMYFVLPQLLISVSQRELFLFLIISLIRRQAQKSL